MNVIRLTPDGVGRHVAANLQRWATTLELDPQNDHYASGLLALNGSPDFYAASNVLRYFGISGAVCADIARVIANTHPEQSWAGRCAAARDAMSLCDDCNVPAGEFAAALRVVADDLAHTASTTDRWAA